VIGAVSFFLGADSPSPVVVKLKFLSFSEHSRPVGCGSPIKVKSLPYSK
jgi:hypothetical protein